MVRGGDPGILGAIGGAIGSIFPGVGTAVGAGLGTLAEGLIGGGRKPSRPATTTVERQYPFLGGVFGGRGSTTITQRPGVPSFGPQMTTGTVTQEIGCPSGYHPNKSGYFTKSEGYIPKGTKCVKNRRRNPANPRALDRAMGRLNSAKRMQSKLAGYSTPKYTKSGRKVKC